MATFIPSPQQQDFFTWIKEGSGSCILEAVAGSGKTTTLIEALKLMDGHIFFGAYNKKIADEIQARAPKKDNLKISTMHAAGYSAWRTACKGSNPKVEGNKLRDIFKGFDEEFAKFEGPVVSLVSYAKQTGVGLFGSTEDDSKWFDLIEHFDVDTMEADGQVVQLAKQLLQRSNDQGTKVIDFDDMIYLPLLNKAKFWTYDWVLIDEAQDLNASRRALALAMLKRGGRMVIVGDRNQAIYSFTGADIDSLDLTGKAVSATPMPLTVTYRCPKAVVTEAQKYVNHITAHESAPEGEVIQLEQGVNLVSMTVPGDAILCRFNRPTMELVYKFIAAGIPAKVEGREIGNQLKALARRWKVKTYGALTDRLAVYAERETSKFRSKGKESMAANIEDRTTCLKVIINRCLEIDPKAENSVERVCREIDSLFDDNVSGKFVLLSSIHKSKGREWDRVILLDSGPAKWARQDWEKQAERNLIYVAVTRAKQTLMILPWPLK